MLTTVYFPACDVYSYNKTWYKSTVPSENNWICDDELKVAHIFAYSKIGEAVGSVIFGWFGDMSVQITYLEIKFTNELI